MLTDLVFGPRNSFALDEPQQITRLLLLIRNLASQRHCVLGVTAMAVHAVALPRGSAAPRSMEAADGLPVTAGA